MTTDRFIEMFPNLSREISHRRIVYFDNAATAHRPRQVIEKMNEINQLSNGNIHRAVHTLSREATDAYEAARDSVVKFINAANRREVIFTSGATAAINLVAYSFTQQFVVDSDEIIVGEAEHHSNIVPWQMAAERRGAKLVYLRMRNGGLYDFNDLDELITPRTRLVCISHASNVLGVVNPIRRVADICHAHGVPLLVDGAQGAVHCNVDVREMDCDFYAFSAHKLYGPTGVGVLYGKEKYLEQMPPFMSGGEMVGTVSLQGTSFAPLPAKFEAGTQNFANVAALAPALEIAHKSLNDNELSQATSRMSALMFKQLKAIDGLRLYGYDDSNVQHLPLFSFTVDGVHHEDLAVLLDKMGIAVRSGQMCAEPLMDHFGVTGMVRASLLPYNTEEEVDYFVRSLRKAVGMLR